MLNSFTSPKSWYMYSRQLSICSNTERKKDRREITWVTCDGDAVRNRVVISSNLVVFPVPDIKCWFLQGLDSLLRQRVLYAPDKNSHPRINRGFGLIKCLLGPRANSPSGNWGHLVWEWPSSRRRSCICTDSSLCGAKNGIWIRFYVWNVISQGVERERSGPMSNAISPATTSRSHLISQLLQVIFTLLDLHHF